MLMMPACVSSRNKSGNRSGRPCSRSSAASLSGVVGDAKRSADRNLGRLFLIRADAHGGGNVGAYQLDAAVFIGGVLVSGIRRLRLRLRLGLLDAQLTSAESDRPSEVARHSRRSSLIPDSPPRWPRLHPTDYLGDYCSNFPSSGRRAARSGERWAGSPGVDSSSLLLPPGTLPWKFRTPRPEYESKPG